MSRPVRPRVAGQTHTRAAAWRARKQETRWKEWTFVYVRRLGGRLPPKTQACLVKQCFACVTGEAYLLLIVPTPPGCVPESLLMLPLGSWAVLWHISTHVFEPRL